MKGGCFPANVMASFSASIEEEFNSISVFNLCGNQRTSGELHQREEGDIFGLGSRTSQHHHRAGEESEKEMNIRDIIDAPEGENLEFKEAKALPDFSGTDAHGVRLTLSGLVLDKNLIVILNKIGAERLESFSTDDFLLINSLFYKHTVPIHLRGRIKRLVELGVIERIGRNKVVLARAFYKATQLRGIRTRLVGLDRETNKELLLKHIQECDPEGTPFRELQQVLPGHSRSQIRTLLNHLRTDGRIRVDGTKSGARWFLDSIDG